MAYTKTKNALVGKEAQCLKKPAANPWSSADPGWRDNRLRY